MRLRWAESADKHQIDHADALWAIEHYWERRAFPDLEGEGEIEVFLGPAQPPSTQRLEVMWKVFPDGLVKIFHVMLMRPKYQHWLDERQREWGGRK